MGTILHLSSEWILFFPHSRSSPVRSYEKMYGQYRGGLVSRSCLLDLGWGWGWVGYICPYARTSFSGPCRCVWVSRLYSFDKRNPALIFVYLGGFGYTHLRGPVSRFGGTLFLTRDPKKWMGAWGVPVHLHGVLDNEPHRTKDV